MKLRLHQYAEIDLDNVFQKFYDTMLSNLDFAGFFSGDEQIRSLVSRQKKFLLDSILLPDEEIKDRYVALGEMHHRIKIPYVDYMAGLDILQQEMVMSVFAHAEPKEFLELTFHFFKLIRAFTAKGYLNKMLEDDIIDIDHYLAHVHRASDVDTMLATERVIWLKNVIFAIKIENRSAAPALRMPPEIVEAIRGAASNDPTLMTYALEISSRMEMNARNVFYFLEKRSYEEVLPLYRELMSIYKLTLMLTNVVTIASTNLQVQSLTKDKLTGLLTRHSFASILSREVSIATASQYQLAFIMMDIDHFKNVNDVYGHSAGDEVLKTIAKSAALTIRATDYAFRMGGEEFLLVLKGASLPVALIQAEVIRKQIEDLTFNVGGQELKVSVSLGVSVFFPPFSVGYEQMTDLADRQLYAAKNSGRNRVCHSD